LHFPLAAGVVESFKPLQGERAMDILLLIGIIVLVVALLGLGGVISALADIAWVLLIVAVIVIAWRLITGRRAV
jgi:uncharacterized membrane protein YtjA (UPF0391 family)